MAAFLERKMETTRDLQLDAARFALASRLVDSLLHDVRNPLNAMAIHLDVLTEKLKVDGKVPPSQEKNLKAIRDQVFRVDGLLRHYADFLSDKPQAQGDVSLSELVQRAAQVVGHEIRKAQLTLRQAVEPEIRSGRLDSSEVAFFIAQALLRAVARSPAGGELNLSLVKESGRAVLKLRDSGADEPIPNAVEAMQAVARGQNIELALSAHELTAIFPLG